jgi:hypothetical protein
VIFQSKVGRKHAYARELIRQLHLIDSPAATKELQDAILINSLVNLRGEKGKAFETDRLLELHNLTLRTFFKERSSSTQEDNDLLEQCSLNGPYFKLLQTKIEGIFGHLSSNRHPKKAASDDIYSVARELASGKLVFQSALRVNTQRFSNFAAVDLYEDGLASLADNIGAYNLGVRDGTSWDDEDDHGDEDNQDIDGVMSVDGSVLGSPIASMDDL